jgi:hypothetical protein
MAHTTPWQQWKPQISGPTPDSIKPYTDIMIEYGYETEVRRTSDGVRLFARWNQPNPPAGYRPDQD